MIYIVGRGEGFWDDFGESEESGGNGTHYFALIDNKYYDAECPEGVDRWQDLPVFKRSK